MFSRFNSTLSCYLYTLFPSRRRSRVSAPLAIAVAGMGAFGAFVGVAPWAAAASNVAATGPVGAEVTAGHAGISIFGSVIPAPVIRAAAVQHAPAARRAAAVRATARPKAAPAPKPYLIYDSVTPTAIPANQRVATYANGLYTAPASSVRGRGSVLWIDTNGSDPSASALDVEPGDATPSGAAQWVKEKLTDQPGATAIVYTMISEWQQVKDAAASLPADMQHRIRYWIADPTGTPHVLAGASATQWYWGANYDITTAEPDF